MTRPVHPDWISPSFWCCDGRLFELADDGPREISEEDAFVRAGELEVAGIGAAMVGNDESYDAIKNELIDLLVAWNHYTRRAA